MKTFRLLLKRANPAILRRIDAYLLTKHPLVWASRIHYAIFWCICVILVSLLTSFLLPISYHNVPNTKLVFTSSLLFGVGMVGLWLYFQNFIHFRTNHGMVSRFHDVKAMILGHGIIILILISSFLSYFTLELRIRRALFDSSLPKISFSDHEWSSSTYEKVDTVTIASPVMTDTAVTPTPEEYAPQELKFPDPTLAVQIEDRVREYNLTGTGKLGNPELAFMVFRRDRSEAKIRDVDTSQKFLLVEYAGTDWYETRIYNLARIYYDDIKVFSNFSSQFQAAITWKQIRWVDSTLGQEGSINICEYIVPGDSIPRYVAKEYLHFRLLEEKITAEVKKRNNYDYELEVRTQLNNLSFIDEGLFTRMDIMYVVYFYLLLFLVLVTTLFIRYYGIRAYILGFGFTCLMAACIIGLLWYGNGFGNEHLITLLIGSGIVLFSSIYFFQKISRVKTRNTRHIVYFQFLCFLIPFAFAIFIPTLFFYYLEVYSRDHDYNSTYDWIIAFATAIPLVFIYPSFLLSRAYQLFCRPKV